MTNVTMLNLSLLQTSVEALATVAFAVSGMLEAARKRLDVVGVCVVAGLAAFGGGTLRDILLDRRPFFWVEHAAWLWVLFVLCLGAMQTLRSHHFELTERAMLWPDAVGLGLFSASGTRIALDMQMPAIVAVLMGVITAVVGGVLRDIVCNEIPRALKDRQPYAICAFIGTWILVLAPRQGWPEWLGMVAAAATVVLLRALTLVSGYRLPAWDPDAPPGA